jgi:hypothetical protein
LIDLSIDENWINLTQDRGTAAGSCEHGKETSGSITDEKFLVQLLNYPLVRNISALQNYSTVMFLIRLVLY